MQNKEEAFSLLFILHAFRSQTVASGSAATVQSNQINRVPQRTSQSIHQPDKPGIEETILIGPMQRTEYSKVV